MKKTNTVFALVAIFFIACTPQVTVIPTPVPTQTPLPTPTLHPEFVAIQNQIEASGNRFSLNAEDGLIYDGGTSIPGLTVATDGTITLTENNEIVILDPTDITFDDEDGISIEGYEYNEETGAWVEAGSMKKQAAIKLLNSYGIDSDTYYLTVTDGGLVVGIDNETGEEILRGNRLGLGFAVDTIAKNSCEVTDFKPSRPTPSRPTHVLYETSEGLGEYMTALLDEFHYFDILNKGVKHLLVLLDREKQCWAIVTTLDLLYRDEKHVAHKIPLIPLTEDEIRDFGSNR